MRYFERFQSTSFASLAVAALVLLATAGCNVGFEGEGNKLSFNFETDEFASKKPLAVQSNVLIRTQLSEEYEASSESESEQSNSEGDSSSDSESSGSRSVEVTSVSSNNSAVISVEQFAKEQKNSFVLKGKSAGTADITVEVKTEDGETVSDGFTMEAQKVQRIELGHACSNDEESTSEDPVYLTGQTVAITKTLYGSDDQELTGRGYNPVEVSGPSSGAKLADPVNDSNLLNVGTGDKAGTVVVKPTVDGDPLELDVKKESAIDTVGWFGGGDNPSLLDSDEEKTGWVLPRFKVQDRNVCRPDIVPDINNKTSSVCSLSIEHFPADKDVLTEYLNAQTVVKVTAKKKGDCKFEISVNDATASANIDVSELIE